MSTLERLWLYDELAGWWDLFSPPSHYIEEADDLLPELLSAPDAPPQTLLELGAGAGSLAYHLKRHLDLTLTDRSPQMLEASRKVNPECRHQVGDMRELSLGKSFDLVLVHDAIMYATDEDALKAVVATAYRHLRPGGGAVFVPDHVLETFETTTRTGGEDGTDGRALRYLQWTWDPDPNDHSYEVAWAFLRTEEDGSLRVDGDHHQFGLFPRATWMGALREVGFEGRSRLDRWGRDVFVARKP
jgi:SAM-dependent methyltransferase